MYLYVQYSRENSVEEDIVYYIKGNNFTSDVFICSIKPRNRGLSRKCHLEIISSLDDFLIH